MTTEYQTFTYTFTAVDDIFTTHASTNINLAFRLYNGFLASSSAYKAAQVYIDDIRVYEELDVSNTTVQINDSEAISGEGNSDALTVYADDSATGEPEIRKTYLSYDLKDVTSSFGASLGVNLSGASGESVKVYVLADATLSTPLTYANAPVPLGAPAASFVAVNGTNYVDISAAISENSGKNIVIILAIEEPSDSIQITATPELEIVKDYHDYTSESQRHEAVAPTYNTTGNVEFYTCAGCEKLYVKNGNDFVEVSAEDIILPTLKYDTQFSGASLNIGKDLTLRYHVTLAEGEDVGDYSVRFTMNDESILVTESRAEGGKYVFSFCGIVPQTMGDNISAELIKNGEIVDTMAEYSVKEYVTDALALYTEDNELCQLLSDLLYYGAASQKYRGYNTGALVTDGVAGLLAYSDRTPTDTTRSLVTNGDTSNASFVAAGVRFDYINTLYVKLTAENIGKVRVTINGADAGIGAAPGNADEYIVYTGIISALDFDTALEFRLYYDGALVQTLTYSVNDYAYGKSQSDSMGELALALYNYGESARAYKNR